MSEREREREREEVKEGGREEGRDGGRERRREEDRRALKERAMAMEANCSGGWERISIGKGNGGRYAAMGICVCLGACCSPLGWCTYAYLRNVCVRGANPSGV